MDRREFLRLCALSGLAVAGEGVWGRAARAAETPWPHEALLYEKLADRRIRCGICPRQCEVADGERGFCGVRENRGGVYYSLVYGRLCAVHVDPIEKKPLFHYLPGSTALSVATAGCNIECKFCQNWNISQFRPEQVPVMMALTPEESVALTRQQGSPTVCFTYSEPTVFYDFVHDTAAAARSAKLGAVSISNGYLLPEALRRLSTRLTAMKVDLKAFTEKFYREVCRGELAPVLTTLKTLKELGMHFEIVVLIVPTLNDSPEEIKQMSGWIASELHPDVPTHFSRFQPMYKLRNLPATPLSTLRRCVEIATGEGLNFVYLGNVPGDERESTYCPQCKKKLIDRLAFSVRSNLLTSQGTCPDCGRRIPGVWTQEQALAQPAGTFTAKG
jgi:pyruvate formate lyase activating enzyme